MRPGTLDQRKSTFGADYLDAALLRREETVAS
ncbi:hypothetical protein HDG69_002445 [Isoptericola halotolerans]|uniref:Uncharacterized protein n=1 Tax=Isoptericola halotolerans TaxID=300560 RepID=A0ABX2A577_9MICO|nr:hypothetical protein [Isoptericola halotolerans]